MRRRVGRFLAQLVVCFGLVGALCEFGWWHARSLQLEGALFRTARVAATSDGGVAPLRDAFRILAGSADGPGVSLRWGPRGPSGLRALDGAVAVPSLLRRAVGIGPSYTFVGRVWTPARRVLPSAGGSGVGS